MRKPTKKSIVLVSAVILGIGLLSLAFVYFVLPSLVASGLAEARPKPPKRTPSVYAMSYEDVLIPADGGVTLAGWLLPAQRPRDAKSPAYGTVVMSHGIHRNREQVLERAAFLSRGGYRVLVFDLRGHGGSTPAPLTGGLHEASDFKAALRYLDSRGDHRGLRVFFGLSLSAMAALRALSDGAQADALVADSPLPDAKAYVARRTAAGMFMRIPGFFERCLESFNRKTGLRLTPGDLELIPVAGRVGVPVLLIAGEKDDLAPAADIQRLFRSLGTSTRRLLYVPEAGHDETYRKFRVMYERGVLEFLRDAREGFPKPARVTPSPARTPVRKK